MSRIDISGLSFGYTEEVAVLKNVDLSIREQTTAIVGQNGAGKTTLVRLLKGLLKPAEGQILLNGEDISGKTVAELSTKIGLVFQNPNDQIFKNKVIDEVMFGPLNIGVENDTARRQARDALVKVGLDVYADENPYDLSLSERKLITIASILAMDTDVIMFDEPTMGQDYAGKERIKSIIEELRDGGKLVICILHDMDFAAEVFERTLVFNQGELLLEGSTSEVFANESVLREAHLEQPHVVQIARQLGFEETPLNEAELITLIEGQAPRT